MRAWQGAGDPGPPHPAPGGTQRGAGQPPTLPITRLARYWHEKEVSAGMANLNPAGQGVQETCSGATSICRPKNRKQLQPAIAAAPGGAAPGARPGTQPRTRTSSLAPATRVWRAAGSPGRSGGWGRRGHSCSEHWWDAQAGQPAVRVTAPFQLIPRDRPARGPGTAHSPWREGGGRRGAPSGCPPELSPKGPVTRQPLLSLHSGLGGRPGEGGSGQQRQQLPGWQSQAGSWR